MTIKRFKFYWHIFWYFRKMRLMSLFEYRADFFFWTTISTIWTVFNFFFFALIANVNNGIGSWSVNEIYLLFSVFTIMDGLMWAFTFENMRTYTTAVFTGSIGAFLVKPIDTQFVMTTQDSGYSEVTRLIIGVVALIWSLERLNAGQSIFHYLFFLVLFVCAFMLVNSMWFILATCSFWLERLDNINDVFPSLRRLWQVPRTIYSGIASTFFTVIVPLGLVVSIPSEILVGKFSLFWSVYFILFSILTFIAARAFFLFSIRRYKGVGN